MKQQRLKKIAEEIKRIVSQTIMTEMKDPRLPSIVTINSVQVTADLKTATIYVSGLISDEADRQEMITVLNGAKGFFRQQIGQNLKVFNTPEPIFVYDDTIVKGMEMDELLRKISHDTDEPESDLSDDQDSK